MGRGRSHQNKKQRRRNVQHRELENRLVVKAEALSIDDAKVALNVARSEAQRQLRDTRLKLAENKIGTNALIPASNFKTQTAPDVELVNRSVHERGRRAINGLRNTATELEAHLKRADLPDETRDVITRVVMIQSMVSKSVPAAFDKLKEDVIDASRST